MKPIKNGAAEVAVIAGTTKDALTADHDSESLSEWRHHALRFAINGAVMAVAGAMAIRSLSKLRAASHNHHEWKVLDLKLDASLKNSGNTSEAITEP